MSNDVEMNDCKTSLMENEEVKLKNPDIEVKSQKLREEFTGLSKEELEKYAKDPFWMKLRLILFIVFWLIWLGMLVVAILIVLMSPKCPKRPKLEFWEKESGYWVDTLSFVDSNGDGIGDFEGLITRLDYIQTQLGAGYIILDPVFAGQYSEKSTYVGSVNSFRDLDSFIGNQNSFKKLIKESRKRGLEIVLTVDFNALSKSSNFIKKNPNSVMKWNAKMESWLSRNGKTAKRKFNGEDIYSYASEESMMIDLDLKNDAVLKEIKESVLMWLEHGVRGFLLTNVASYVENQTVSSLPTNYAYGNKWYTTKSMNGQIFSVDTAEFLKKIRVIMDDVAKKTDKSRLLILDAGNVGFGLGQANNPDVMLQYLDGPDKIADLIIGREFLRNRGWNVNDEKLSKSSVKNYLQMIPENKRNRIALTSATSTSLRVTSLQKLAAPFLLPGNPIIYFGSELGADCNISSINSVKVPFYPENRLFPLASVAGELPTKCNHMIMPWDNTGKGFYNKNLNSTHDYILTAANTVEGLSAVGREETILQLYQKLIKIRSEPSLLWGDIKMFFNQKMAMNSYEIFIREAEGFPKIIVALIQDSIEGKVFSLSSVCSKVVPLVVFPLNDNLPTDKEIEADNIYLKINGKESIHVFKCAS